MYTEVVAENIVKLVLRLPADLHAVLVEMAKQEQRSLNGQIVYLLQQAISRKQR
jgi:hypothetical protein